ncbi:hypothetical protein Bca52824_065093 [Brassica carinata]|uniref:Uncharacterized protein n=1 Tax=Brassica carinata TaxID=52824 RepID=A0A8X7QJ26_BRACI|nr:hypothetical protein Bca52824_065093 [Brassica carinata]
MSTIARYKRTHVICVVKADRTHEDVWWWMWDIATGHSVCNHFFLEITERKWMYEHMHVIMNMLWKRRDLSLSGGW